MAQSARTVRRRWLIIAIGVVILIGMLLSAASYAGTSDVADENGASVPLALHSSGLC